MSFLISLTYILTSCAIPFNYRLFTVISIILTRGFNRSLTVFHQPIRRQELDAVVIAVDLKHNYDLASFFLVLAQIFL